MCPVMARRFWRSLKAVPWGCVADDLPEQARLKTAIGGTRIVATFAGEVLPCVC